MSYYSDINLNFKPHPLTGDVTTLIDDNAVKRSLVHIGEMLPFDIPFQPNWHGHIRELLFELPSATTTNVLEKNIRWAIKKMEPRAVVDDVEIQLTNNETAYSVIVRFHVISLIDQYEINFYLERIR